MLSLVGNSKPVFPALSSTRFTIVLCTHRLLLVRYACGIMVVLAKYQCTKPVLLTGCFQRATPAVSCSCWPDRSAHNLLFSPAVACKLCLRYHGRYTCALYLRHDVHAGQMGAHITRCTHRLLPARYTCSMMVMLVR